MERPVSRRSVAALVAVAAGLIVLLGARPADATWSIVAVDPETGLVGVAMASCVPASVLGDPDAALVPAVLVPGQAAGVVQGTIDPEGPGRLRQYLLDGSAPEEALQLLSADDDLLPARQYAVAAVGGASVGVPGDDAEPGPIAAFTGDQVEAVSGTAERVEPDRVVAAGVLMADGAVVDRAVEAFVAARVGGRSLDRALADALVAGSNAGGDRRCDEQTALFAHLAVAEPDDDPLRPSLLLTVTVDEGDGQNPVHLLDEALDDGRTGWIDAGLIEPAGVPRLLVLGVAVILTVAAVVVLWVGMGSPSARRSSRS